MEWKKLDKLIGELYWLLPKPLGQRTFMPRKRSKMSDWKAIWAKERQIQKGFNSGVRYPTKKQRDKAWKRFNELRDEASSRCDAENKKIERVSREHRKAIFSKAQSLKWDVADVLINHLKMHIPFKEQTSAREMKERGRLLNEAFQMLTNRKEEMLGEDKQECYSMLKEVEESHDAWWEAYKEFHRKRHKRNQKEWKRKRKENLRKNQKRLEKAEGALSHHRKHAKKLRSDIASAWNEEWAKDARGWLAEHQAKIEEIEDWIDTIQEWIEEDLRELRKIE